MFLVPKPDVFLEKVRRGVFVAVVEKIPSKVGFIDGITLRQKEDQVFCICSEHVE